LATYTYAQLEGLWEQAGGSAALAPLMAAIALAESSGNPDATNPTDNNGTQTSWGLWQISDGTHNQPVPGILNPLTNAQQAVAKIKSQGLSAWGTYDSGAYKQFLQGNVPASAVPPAASGSTPAAGGTAAGGTGGSSGATGSSSTATTAAATPTGFNIGSLLGAITGLARDVATVLDYIFGMFGRGQGWRLVFTVVCAVTAYGSYRCLASAGAVPDVGKIHAPSAVIV
jgi:hypothetical protein